MGAITERMKTGFTISAAVHIAVVLWAVITFVSKPLNAQQESMSVDVVTADQFTKMTAGVETAKKVEPKPLADKIGERKAATSEAAKITEKQEVVAVREQTPPPQPEVKKVEAKPTPSKPEQKSDPIAEALKKDESKKKEEKKQEEKPEKMAVPQKPQRAYDPAKVAALLDKRDSQRLAAYSDEISKTNTVGAVAATAPMLSQNEMDALKAKLRSNWSPPIGAEKVSIMIYVMVGRDGRLSAPPRFASSGTGSMFDAAREAALRAVLRTAPFEMLRQETYEAWREMELVFDETLIARR